MAERIGTARQAARHTGREYGKGYPYNMDQEFTVEFGPFKGYSAAPGIGFELSHIQSMFNTAIRPSGTLASLALIETNNLGAQTIGHFQMRVNGVMYHVAFLDDGGTDIDVVITETNDTQTTHASPIAHGDDRVDAEPWGVRIYFVSVSLADVRFLDLSGTPAFSSVGSSPDNGKFLFLLGNNMVQISQDTTTKLWSAAWAIDSDPTDWTGAGSGSNNFASDLGDPVGYGRMGQRMVVVFEFGGVSMNPTGTLPVFQFIDEPAISGGIGEVSSDKTNIYYVYRTQHLVKFQGNQEVRMGHGEELQTNTTAIYYSQACGCLVVTDSSVGNPPDQILFYDTKTLEVVGRADGPSSQVYISDRPDARNISQLYINRAAVGTGSKYTFPNYVSAQTDVTGSGTILTEYISFPQPVTIVKIRIIFGAAPSGEQSNVTCGILWFPGTLAAPTTPGDTGFLTATNTAEDSPVMDYDFNQVVDQFKVQIKWPSTSAIDLEIRKIIVYCRLTTDDDVEVMR